MLASFTGKTEASCETSFNVKTLSWCSQTVDSKRRRPLRVTAQKGQMQKLTIICSKRPFDAAETTNPLENTENSSQLETGVFENTARLVNRHAIGCCWHGPKPTGNMIGQLNEQTS